MKKQGEFNWMGGTECSPATPAAEGVPHGGMGGARTDGGHSVTGPIFKFISFNLQTKSTHYCDEPKLYLLLILVMEDSSCLQFF